MSTELWNDETGQPLQHIRVVDSSTMLPAPLLTRLLAQYGAEVIKIEGLPHGDHLRADHYDALFELTNRGKRSVALNLRDSQSVEIIKQLVGEADVFVENFRSGIADGIGVGYSELSEVNPDLIYLSIRGFSEPLEKRVGHDLNFIANSGCGEWFLENETPNHSTQFADVVGGTLIPALRLLMHLCNPARRGMHLVCHMDQGFRFLYLARAFESFSGNSDSPDQNTVHNQMSGEMPHSRFYRCRDDRWISLNSIQKKHWETFCEVMDQKSWKERWDDPSLCPELEKMFRDAPSNYWEALANKEEICLFRVIPWDEHLNYTQAGAQLGGDPLTWCGFSPNLRLGPAPKLGGDTFAVLSGVGYSNKEIAEWASNGVLKMSGPAPTTKTD